MRFGSIAARLTAAVGISLAALGGLAGAAQAQNRNCVDTLMGLADGSRFAGVLSFSHMAEDIKGAGYFTVFAPTDSALEAASFVADRVFPRGSGSMRELDPVLGPASVNARILDGRYTSASLPAGETITTRTRAGNTITVSSHGGKVTITGHGGSTALVIRADIPCSNGVIHVIDHVLLK
jgi:uncharacterized surface protein with fasciclin (FAS1) repeats